MVQESLLKLINNYKDELNKNGTKNDLKAELNYYADSKVIMYMYLQMKNFIENNNKLYYNNNRNEFQNELQDLLKNIDINICIL